MNIGFTSSKIETEIKCNGFSTFSLLNKSDMELLHTLVKKYHPDLFKYNNEKYYTSMFSKDIVYKKEILDVSRNVVMPKLNLILKDYKVIVSSIQIKGASEISGVNCHQDLSITRFPDTRSYTLWIPLTDSTITNGTLYFLPDSHNCFDQIRSQTIDQPFYDVQDIMKKYMVPVTPKTGNVILFDQACIHYSPPNYSSQARVSIALTIVPLNAQLTYYFGINRNSAIKKIAVYKVSDDFWYMYQDFENERYLPPPGGQLICEIDNSVPIAYTSSTFIKLYTHTRKFTKFLHYLSNHFKSMFYGSTISSGL